MNPNLLIPHTPSEGEAMKEGYYWIQHGGIVQVAYFTPEEFEDIETGRMITGVWHLAMNDDICHNGEAEVLEGPLQPPK
jgi:hypothetical protein